jgi:adenosylcobinamide-GDP ribazoletransferase
VKLPSVLRGSRAAFCFFTRLPVGGYPYSAADWKWSVAWFPFVGLTIGLLMAALWQSLQGAGPLVAAALSLASGVLLTGGLHEDGLADSADALGGATNRQQLLQILKDSRIGSYGALALCLSLLVRVGALVQLATQAPVALIFSQCASRLPPVALMRILPYVTAQEVSRSRQLMHIGTAQLLLALLWPLGLMVLLLQHHFIEAHKLMVLGLCTTLVFLLCGWRFWARAGGLTGDFLGATQQLSECAMLIVLGWKGGPF